MTLEEKVKELYNELKPIDMVVKVVHEGYSDEDDVIVTDSINDYLAEHPDTIRGNADLWNAK